MKILDHIVSVKEIQTDENMIRAIFSGTRSESQKAMVSYY